jgi:hypothetical protein
MTAEVALDDLIKEAVSVTAGSLAYSAQAVGASKIGETKFMQPALYAALTDLRLTAQNHKTGLHFKHCQGPSEIRLGGIDIAVHRDDGSGYRAFLELKWGNPDWMILDFYKMTIARLSPGADSCYLVAGQPLTHWAKTDSVVNCSEPRGGGQRTSCAVTTKRSVGTGRSTGSSRVSRPTSVPRSLPTRRSARGLTSGRSKRSGSNPTR